jgi:hypothetical protein
MKSFLISCYEFNLDKQLSNVYNNRNYRIKSIDIIYLSDQKYKLIVCHEDSIWFLIESLVNKLVRK